MKKWCVVMMSACAVALVLGCESKKETPATPDAGATATAPVVDAGGVNEADASTGATAPLDMAPDEGALDQPLKLELDRNLFPATKSGVMPNIDFQGGGESLKLEMNGGLGVGSGSAPQDSKNDEP